MAPPVENPPPKAQAGERIAKLLARAGVASRREIERYIAEGRVARDGVVIDTPATVLASLRGVTVDGEPVASPEPTRLFLYHKPTGLLVTERDPRGRPTIYDRLPGDLPRVVPVGRLDVATEGLLLLTTDGGFKRQLELPATGVERAYRARCYGQIAQAQLEELMEGVEIEGIRYGPINANLERRTGANTWIEMILTEGKNREVRRVLEHLGLQVGRLIRTRYGPFILGDLPPGAVGEVRQSDVVAFRQTLGGKRQASEERIAVNASAKPARRTREPAREAVAHSPGRSRQPDPSAIERSPRPRQAPGRPSKPDPSAVARSPRAKLPPGAGRGAVTVRPDRGGHPPVDRRDPRRGSSAAADARPSRQASPARTERASSRQDASELSPGLRRSGARGERKPDVTAGDTRRPSEKRLDEAAVTTPRPAKIQRKTGWAKPKPPSGPRRPGKR